MPTIGAIPGLPNCYVAMGYGGNGITFSMMAAQMLRGMITGAGDPDTRLGIIAALNPPDQGVITSCGRLSAVVLFLAAVGAAHAAGPGSLSATEARFLEFLDARDAAAYLETGHVEEWEGAELDAWNERLRTRHQALTANIATLKPAELPPADAAALAAIRVTLADFGDPSPAARTSRTSPPARTATTRRSTTKASPARCAPASARSAAT